MEIVDYKEINKNCLQGFFDLKIEKWGNFIIRELAIFNKGNERWIAYPSKKYESAGKTKYYSFVTFEDPAFDKKFKEDVMNCLDKYLKTKQTNNKIDNIKDSNIPEQDELPF